LLSRSRATSLGAWTYWGPALGLFAFFDGKTQARSNTSNICRIPVVDILVTVPRMYGIWLRRLFHTGIPALHACLMLILGNSYQGTDYQIALFAMGLAFLIPFWRSRIRTSSSQIIASTCRFTLATIKTLNGRKETLVTGRPASWLR